MNSCLDLGHTLDLGLTLDLDHTLVLTMDLDLGLDLDLAMEQAWGARLEIFRPILRAQCQVVVGRPLVIHFRNRVS